MRKQAGFFCLALSLGVWAVTGGVPAQAQEPGRQATIERILDLMNAQSSVDRMLDQVTSMINTQMKAMAPNATPQQLAQVQALQTKLMELVRSRMSWEKMRPEFARIYGETYSDDELNGMLAFFQTPAGRGFLSKTPVLSQKILEWSQAQMAGLMPEIQRLAKDALQQKQN